LSRRVSQGTGRAIELIDKQVVRTVLEGLEKYNDYRVLILPDHPTPLSARTHTREPVPFILYQRSHKILSGVDSYDETNAQKTGLAVNEGFKLMDHFINHIPF